jgi:hypothetical protein
LLFALVPAIWLFGAAEFYVQSAELASGPYRSGGSLGWTARPNLEGYSYRSRANSSLFVVTTNEDGLRTPYTRQRMSDDKRVMVFGESTIFGWGVSKEGLPAARLEAALGEGWEVVNGGQPGYTSEQVLRLTRLALPAYRPDVVVMFHTWNDARSAEKTDRDFLPEHLAVTRSKWWAKSELLRWLAEPKEGDASDDLPQMPRAPILSYRVADAGETHRVPPEHRAENIAAVADLSRSVGAQFVLATLPPGGPGVTLRSLCPAHPVCSQLSTAADLAGAPFFNLAPSVGGLQEASVLLYGDPGHFTEFANDVMMRSLAASLLAYFESEE